MLTCFNTDTILDPYLRNLPAGQFTFSEQQARTIGACILKSNNFLHFRGAETLAICHDTLHSGHSCSVYNEAAANIPIGNVSIHAFAKHSTMCLDPYDDSQVNDLLRWENPQFTENSVWHNQLVVDLSGLPSLSTEVYNQLQRVFISFSSKPLTRTNQRAALSAARKQVQPSVSAPVTSARVLVSREQVPYQLHLLCIHLIFISNTRQSMGSTQQQKHAWRHGSLATIFRKQHVMNYCIFYIRPVENPLSHLPSQP